MTEDYWPGYDPKTFPGMTEEQRNMTDSQKARGVAEVARILADARARGIIK